MNKIIEWNIRRTRRSAVAAFFTAISLTSTPLARAQIDDIRRFDLRIENGRVADGGKTIAVKRGDRVEINWRADRPMVLHLHGYDIEVEPRPERPATMTFNARATGRFAVETHSAAGQPQAGRHAILSYLEVHPRSRDR